MSESLHFVIPGPLDQRTGGYLYDAHMVRGLRERGWSVDVHSLDGRFPEVDANARDDLARTLRKLPDGARVIADGLAAGPLPDVLESNTERLRLLVLVHHPLADETGLTADEVVRFTRSETEALAACTGIVVTSGYTAGRLEDFDVPARKVRAVPPGTRPAGPARGPGPDEPHRLLCVATITPRKGHDVLVDALDRVRDLEWSCTCAGSLERDRAWVQRIRTRVTERELQRRVDFAGEHDEAALDVLYDRSSLFVLASHYEGYGMALTEAIARGLPVVSTTGGAIPWTVPADAGILVEPADPEALAEGLRAALEPGRHGRMREAALEAARDLPDWDASVDAFAAAVLELAP